MNATEVFKKLIVNRIPFYITGSYAVELYTGKRNPNDIDVVIRRKDIPKIEKILNKSFRTYDMGDGTFRSSIKLEDIEVACFDDFNIKGKKVSFGYQKDTYQSYKKMKVGGLHIRVIDPEELIIFKLVRNKNHEGKQDFLDVVKLTQVEGFNKNKCLKLGLKYKLFMHTLKVLLVSKLSKI